MSPPADFSFGDFYFNAKLRLSKFLISSDLSIISVFLVMPYFMLRAMGRGESISKFSAVILVFLYKAFREEF